MKKEKVNEKNVADKATKLKLTERESAAIRWAGSVAYHEISSYFYDECDEDLVSQYINVVSLLRGEDDDHALYLVSTLLRHACCLDILKLVTDLCKPGDESTSLFITTFLTTAYYDLIGEEEEVEDNFYETGDDENEEEFEDELEGEPFACINVAVNEKKVASLGEVIEHVLNAIGIASEEMKKKEECEESEQSYFYM